MNLKYLAIGLVIIATLTGCAKKAQQSVVDTALNNSATETSESAEENTEKQTGTQAPASMPPELLPAGITVSSSTNVADGYQSIYSTKQTQDEVVSFYKGLSGWKVVAEFSTEATKSISLENSGQRVLISISPANGIDDTTVVVTGSLVKE